MNRATIHRCPVPAEGCHNRQMNRNMSVTPDEFIAFFCEPAVLLSLEGTVLALNSSAHELLGTTADGMVGKPLAALVCESPPKIIRYLRSCADADQPVLGSLSWRCFEQRQSMLCHGQAFPAQRILLRCIPEMSPSQAPRAGPASPAQCLQDITRRRWLAGRPRTREVHSGNAGAGKNRPLRKAREIYRLRERLARFDQFSILSEMTTAIAHEINQSLTGIATYARGCRRQLESGRSNISELSVILDKISDQARQSGEFVHSLRRLANKHDDNRELCDLNQLVQDSLKLISIEDNLPEIPIDTVLTEDRLPIIADPIQIRQALLHLLRNAIEATLEAGINDAAIVVTTTVDGCGFAKVLVTDRGSGLSTEAREKLFDPFYSTKPQSLGMGLAVCRTLIISHAGRIGFIDHPEDGTTLYFTLPLAKTNGGDD